MINVHTKKEFLEAQVQMNDSKLNQMQNNDPSELYSRNTALASTQLNIVHNMEEHHNIADLPMATAVDNLLPARDEAQTINVDDQQMIVDEDQLSTTTQLAAKSEPMTEKPNTDK